jgi:hypothetical protein
MCDFYEDLYINLEQIPCLSCEEDVASKLQAVPNPVSTGNRFQLFTYNPDAQKAEWIYGEELEQNSKIEVYATSGQFVANFVYQTGGQNVPNLAAGTYLIKATTPQGEVVKTKLIIREHLKTPFFNKHIPYSYTS